MENNFFIYTKKNIDLKIEKFHICAWEFKNNSALIEFGFEIKNYNLSSNEETEFNIYIPWVTEDSAIFDLFNKLKYSENSKFIFNDSVVTNEKVTPDQPSSGIVLEFYERAPLCIMPIKYNIIKPGIVNVKVKNTYFRRESVDTEKTNLYCRFYIKPDLAKISVRKAGITKTSIIYEMKINEKRNLPNSIDLNEINLCDINQCFLLNILPNSFDLVSFNTKYIKSIRNLEYESFKKYLDDSRVEEDELVVVFNKMEGLRM